MKTKELFEVCGLTRDIKARRRSNISDIEIPITAQEIEKGITFERLQELPVAPLCYATQITLHGKLPDVNDNARINGYKAIIVNANGSIGVKYTAIDADKKRTIRQALDASKSPWSLHITSNECYLSAVTPDKAACALLLNSISAELFYGEKYGFPCPYGSGHWFAEIVLNAIPLENVWMLASALQGATSQQAIDDHKVKEEEEYRKRDVIWQAERKKEQEERTAKFHNFLKENEPNKLSVLPAIPFKCRIADMDWNNVITVKEYTIQKHFGKLSARQEGKKGHTITIEKLNAMIVKGRLFKAS